MSVKLKKVRYILCFGAILLLCSVVITTSGCVLYALTAFKYAREGGQDLTENQETGSDPAEVLSSEAQITLAWDPPPSAVDTYKLLFRIHDTQDWYLIEQITAEPSPQYTVLNDDLGNGMFDFGVKAVDSGSEESVLLICLSSFFY